MTYFDKNSVKTVSVAQFGEEYRRLTAKQQRAEYEICQRRGHQPSNTVLTSNPPQNVCRWCGTNYRFSEPTLIEGRTPQ